jgi:hypothetical protein
MICAVRMFGVALVGGSLFVLGTAHAGDLPCALAEDGVLSVDGLLDDWRGEAGVDLGGRDLDLSATARCNLDSRSLYLAVDVRDDLFVRTPAASAGEDHLTVRLGSRTLALWPADGKLKEKASWSPAGAPPKGLKIASSRQPSGWAVELSLPLGQVPDFSRGTPSVPFALTVHDGDSRYKPKIDATVTLDGALTFAEGQGARQALLAELRAKESDVAFELPVKLGPRSSARALVTGKALGVLLEDGGFAFVTLPVSSKKDVLSARAIDLAGDGCEAIVVTYVERGGGGERELLAAFRPLADRVERVFAVETRKRSGAATVATKVTWVKRGKATDLLLEPQPAVGVDASSWREQPAEDVIPILLPWGADKKALYQFRGNEYLRK